MLTKYSFEWPEIFYEPDQYETAHKNSPELSELFFLWVPVELHQCHLEECVDERSGCPPAERTGDDDADKEQDSNDYGRHPVRLVLADEQEKL
jgi:hypothetical protein